MNKVNVVDILDVKRRQTWSLLALSCQDGRDKEMPGD